MPGPLPSSRRAARGITPIEGAIGFAILGTLLAIAIPAFARNVHATYTAEAFEGLDKIGGGALKHAEGKPASKAFPPSVPLTPAEAPKRGRVADTPGTWTHATWIALAFEVPEGATHAFSFSFDSTATTVSTFSAIAKGDLDGDGITSHFEIQGRAEDGRGASISPGIIVHDELE